ncbi:MAG: cation:proton antiporter [Acidimicrobiia bacterium]
MIVAAAYGDPALVLLELGGVVFGLAIIARLADRIGFSPIPLYLFAGLMFGEGGVVRPDFTNDFITLSAEIGVVLLLLTLGIEYTASELRDSLRSGFWSGALDLVVNATPGAVAGIALGFGAAETLALAGVTYTSSSGIAAKVLRDLDRLGNRETPTVLTLLVVEDLAMAMYLPVMAIVFTGGTAGTAAASVAIALSVLAFVLVVALRHGSVLSRMLATRSNESLLLSLVGLTLLVAGVAQWVNISAAIGAFLVGIALSGSVQQRAAKLIEPLRDLFAALFFLFFGLQIDPSKLVSALPVATALVVITGLGKVFVGAFAAKRNGVGRPGQIRAGTVLIARGEFSIVVAGLAAASGASPELGSLAAAYVLLSAAAGPIITRFVEPAAGPGSPAVPL